MQSSPVSPAWLIGRGHKATSAALPDRPSGQWLMHNPLQINNTSAAPPPSPSPTNAHNRFRNATLAAAHRFRQESKKKTFKIHLFTLKIFRSLSAAVTALCCCCQEEPQSQEAQGVFFSQFVFFPKQKEQRRHRFSSPALGPEGHSPHDRVPSCNAALILFFPSWSTTLMTSFDSF